MIGRIGVALAVLVAACGGDDAGTTTIDPAAAAEAYCSVLEGATTRGSEETMGMLEAAALPEIADLLDRMLRGESSGQDPLDLGAFNEATCGIRWP
jgi:hypothetical protein